MGGSRSSSNSPVPSANNNSESAPPPRSTRNGKSRNGTNRATSTSYKEIMGHQTVDSSEDNSQDNNNNATGGPGAVQSLSARLVAFRKWLKDAGVVVHPAICIVNGEATDGTRNAPVLVFGPPATTENQTAAAVVPTSTASSGRVGVVDGDGDCALYDRTMGCQLRAVREMKKGEVVLTMPRSAMITPDLVACSDAGRAVLACCQDAPLGEGVEPGFWNALENTTVCEQKFRSKLATNTSPQLLVKILQERKRAETALTKRLKRTLEADSDQTFALAQVGTVSTRAPFLAFLIHQRFSNSTDPSVSSASLLDFCASCNSMDGNALRSSRSVMKPIGSLDTYAPYARTLPSSVSLPLCWKRNELALLAGCIPGMPLLYTVAGCTHQLAAEFIALLQAGILERFPDVFPEGLLTWERWVWAAAVFSSRTLPASVYLNKGDQDASFFRPELESEFQSQPEIWQELGVMVPLLDMANHETEDYQTTWKPSIPPLDQVETMAVDDDDSANSIEPHPPRAVLHAKIRKGSELYINYGELSNQQLILQYGFAQMNNLQDELKMGWGLSDAVGNLDLPQNYSAIVDLRLARKNRVFESTDSEALNAWWTPVRLDVLESVAFTKTEDDSFMALLKAGKKMTTAALCDGTYQPFLLTAALIATMPPKILMKYSGTDAKIVVTKLHQRVIRDYLIFTFTRKLEKLLQNLENGLKDHFGNMKLWTKASEGGLKYKPEEGSENASQYIGWQSFFDSHAYSATMEVENRYYAMGADSCVLTLYDGHLRALQASIDGVADTEKFRSGVLQQLEDLDFEVATGDESTEDQGNAEGSGNEKKSKTRRRNRKKNSNSGDRPPAMKLHIGNLSYSTTPSDLYDSFSAVYGTDNILECHIPIERDTGRSRGFGFVTLPETIGTQALRSGQKHEIDGRLLKVAKSNSAGSTTTSGGKGPSGPAGLGGSAVAVVLPPSNDRCSICGYRPKYCVCQASNNAKGDYAVRPSGPAASDRGRDFSYYGGGGGGGGGGGRHRDDRPRDEPPHHRGRDRGEPADRYGRVYEQRDSRSYEHRYDDRGDDRHRSRSRGDHRRSRDRSRSSGRGSSRYESSRRSRSPDEGRSSSRRERTREPSRDRSRDRADDEGEYSRSRKRSSSRSRERSRKKKSKRRRSRSRSQSPPQAEK